MTLGELAGIFERHKAAEERTDRRFASLMVLYANSHRDPSKRSEPFTIEDFTGRAEPSHNGHVDTGASLRQSIETLKHSTNIRAVEMAPNDPRRHIDREEIEKFLRDQA